MKILKYAIVLFLICLYFPLGAQDIPSDCYPVSLGVYKITAPSGLTLRNQPHINAIKITTIPYGDSIRVWKVVNTKKDTIDGKIAHWYNVSYQKGAKEKLGTITFAEVETDHGKLVIVNGYTQFNWKGQGKKVDYDALRSVFQGVKQKFSGLRIGYPAIGAGLAGGDWEEISKIIDQELAGEKHTFVAFGG